MDLLLNEQQLMLQSTVQDLLKRDFTKERLAEFDSGKADLKDQWDSVCSTGILGSLIPEKYGGVGGSFSDTGVVFQELGKGPLPGPHFTSSVLAANLIIQCGTESQKQNYLPRIAEGKFIFSVAISNLNQSVNTIFEDFRLAQSGVSGVRLNIPELRLATHVIVPFTSEPGIQGLAVIPTNTYGLSIRPLTGMSTEQYELKTENVKIEEILTGFKLSAFSSALIQSTALLCSFQVGGLERVFEMCLTYSKTRHQFGQPIGRFQRVQDHIIDIVNYLDSAKWTTYEALWKLDTAQESKVGIHMAGSLASEGYYLGCNAAHDVHAGVGIIREYGLTLHTKMSRTLYSYLGNPWYHRNEIAKALYF